MHDLQEELKDELSWREIVFSNVDNRKEHVIKILYSGFYFVLSFILISYLGDAISAMSAWSVGFHPTFSYDGLQDMTSTSGWTVGKVRKVCLSPPLLGMFISIVALIWFQITAPERTHRRTLLFWISVNGFLLYYSYLFTGLLCTDYHRSQFYDGFVAYYSWLHWDKDGIPIILTAQAALSLIYVLLFLGPIKKLNYSNSLFLQKHGKMVVLLNVLFLPFIAGVLMVLLSTFPMNMEYQLIRISSFIPVLTVCVLGINYGSPSQHFIIRGGMKPRPKMLLIFLSIVLLVIVRTVLSLDVGKVW